MAKRIYFYQFNYYKGNPVLIQPVTMIVNAVKPACNASVCLNAAANYITIGTVVCSLPGRFFIGS